MRGTPTIESANKAKARDHPRVCGEHAADGLAVLEAQGSSPRMRGTRCSVITRNGSTGIIPAYAGNTLRWTRYHCRRRDHPRVCGEHFFRSFVDEWGGDHPRVCGEHMGAAESTSGGMGSSPRMRGTLLDSRTAGWNNGIIPAYAGNTPKERSVPSVSWDHPRVCGEHYTAKGNDGRNLGSSPRMRGTRCITWSPLGSAGIIPAYAGNTMTSAAMGNEAAGSSPRMRGTRRQQVGQSRTIGIIPAYAGNTV